MTSRYAVTDPTDLNAMGRPRFGYALRRWREDHHLSQGRLADKLGWPIERIQVQEAQDCDMNLPLICTLASGLKRNPRNLEREICRYLEPIP